MAEVLVQFSTPVSFSDGRSYVVRVCGREADDRLWEGWIEFDPQDGSPVLRTPRETEQPNRDDLQYWATGLSVAYLEGALERARRPPMPVRHPVDSHPTYDGPAPRFASDAAPAATRTQVRPHAVLNPFAVFAQGEDVLREELAALAAGHLRTIVRAYDLDPAGEAELRTLEHAVLAERIVSAARRRAE